MKIQKTDEVLELVYENDKHRLYRVVEKSDDFLESTSEQRG